jgi:FkbM family methyltransferase
MKTRQNKQNVLIFCFFSILFAGLIGVEGYRKGVKYGKEGRIPIHPIHKNFSFSTTLPNGLTYVGNGGSNLDLIVLELGYYEPHTIQVLQESARWLSAKGHSNTYLDIGANVGLHTLAMSPLVNKVIAVEPYPVVLSTLHQHISLNKLTNVEVLELGFGNKNDKLKFVAPPDKDIGIGTFSTDVYDNNPFFKNRHHKTLESSELYFDIVPGDTVLKDQAIDILKVDIEGYERYALEGLKEVLQKNKPVVVMKLNQNRDGGFISSEQLESTLPDYTFYRITDDSHSPCLSTFKFDPNYKGQTQLFGVTEAYRDLSVKLMSTKCDELN